MKKNVLIFAGGVGQRMGTEKPKQFLEICGKEIIIHTLELFEDHDEIDSIYVACKEEYIPFLKKLVKKYDISKVHSIFPGGETGQDSIYIGLKTMAKYEDEDSIVLIHDGVRPIVTPETISTNIKTVMKYGSAITATPCFETPIISTDGKHVKEMPLRSIVYTAQAPQSFYLKDILNAHKQVRKVNPTYEGIVDSCGLMHSLGHDVRIIEGNRGNIKVTTYNDFFSLIGILNANSYNELFETDNIIHNKKIKIDEGKGAK